MTSEQQQPTLHATVYMGEEQFLDTLGPRIVAGRQFAPDEFIEWSAFDAPDADVEIPSVIITRSMADKLFPGQDAVGKSFYRWGDNPIRVVGVVDHLVRPSDQGGQAALEYSKVFPINVPYSLGGNYLLRTEPGRCAEELTAAVDALARTGPNRIIITAKHNTRETLRDEKHHTGPARGG